MSISKQKRFRVFRRDLFTCQYCGACAPDTALHVDHRLAKANGGTDAESNLVTSCADCNVGKGVMYSADAPRTRIFDEIEDQVFSDENFITVTQDDPYLRSLYGEIVL